MSKVRALYDFSAEPGTTEISINAGDILTVVRRDVGEGWLEGSSHDGKVGLFPAAYVEELQSEPPSMPPPPPPIYSEVPDADWGNINEWQTSAQHHEPEEWDDDWDEDSETGTTQPVSSTSISTVHTAHRGEQLGRGTVGKKSFNRFSSFVKSGGESYILGSLKLTTNISDSDTIKIYESGSGVEWEPISNPYSCVVASPKKESKLKGLKSFIAYQLTPTFNNIQVSRRYKQFDWLHERLQEKFSSIPIPPLPDKQISGRYEEQFIEHRKTQLQAFVNCVCRHPVLSRSAVWLHFITCTDEKQWKAGKRRAERDELIGAKLFLAIKSPEKPLESFLVEQETDDCARFINAMDQSVRNLAANAVEQSKRMQNSYNRDCQKKAGKRRAERDELIGAKLFLAIKSPEKPLESFLVEQETDDCARFINAMYQSVRNLAANAVEQSKRMQNSYNRDCQKVGQALMSLSAAFDLDKTPGNPRRQLTAAIRTTGEIYNDLGRLMEDQPKNDWEPLGDVLHIYKGIISSFPDILTVQRNAQLKRKECEKSALSSTEQAAVRQRTDVVSYALMAEINHFHEERAADFKTAMHSFLSEQITFYQKIVDQLKVALNAYEY